jgi:hypothetical protein
MRVTHAMSAQSRGQRPELGVPFFGAPDTGASFGLYHDSTPLHSAAAAAHREMVEALLRGPCRSPGPGQWPQRNSGRVGAVVRPLAARSVSRKSSVMTARAASPTCSSSPASSNRRSRGQESLEINRVLLISCPLASRFAVRSSRFAVVARGLAAAAGTWRLERSRAHYFLCKRESGVVITFL